MSAATGLRQTRRMRVLMSERAATGDEVSEETLGDLYRGDGALLRINFVSTIDGAATGGDGRSGSINSPADHRGFTAMRAAADVLLVGAGTVRAEEYGPARLPVVVVSSRPVLPDSLREQPGVVLATTRTSGATESESVWISGEDRVDLPGLVERVRSVFGPHVLSEGGPSLAAELVALDLVDEVALSWTPRLVGGSRGDHPRFLDGADVDIDLTCRHLLEEDGTLLGLWRVER